MTEANPERPPAGKLAWVALLFGCAAALSAWNPFAAPFGAIVGVASALLGLRAWRSRQGHRGVALGAVSMGAAAALGSVATILVSAGAVTGDLTGDPVVESRTAAEVSTLLNDAAQQTASARERAARDLQKGPDGPSKGSRSDGSGAGHQGSARNGADLQSSPDADVAEAQDEPE